MYSTTCYYTIMYRILPHLKNKGTYFFNKYFGFVYYVHGDNFNQTQKIYFSKELRYVINPFLLHSREKNDVPNISLLTRIFAYILVFSWKYCYPLIYLISHLRFSIYEDAGSANLAFREITKHKNQRVLCLPRAIFIATTSKRFKQHGAMFIGCFFPSRHMHAWVIEDGMQADVFDNQWTSFTPLVIMRHK